MNVIFITFIMKRMKQILNLRDRTQIFRLSEYSQQNREDKRRHQRSNNPAGH